MPDLTQNDLKNFQAQNQFLIGIDSDGCVFDSMEIKHKECFCPAYINNFGIQPVAKYAREVWDFVNLYSMTRGYNRFKAVIVALDLLAEREEVKVRNVDIPKIQDLRDWVKRETRLGNPVLEQELKKNPSKDLEMALSWSLDVNAAVKKIVRNVPPFPKVRESLEKIKSKADVIVVSQTPSEALIREWKENKIDGYVSMICGQELGTKTEHLRLTSNGKYEPDHVLMVGDAPGDMKAARANNALFFPINPGKEEASWDRFYSEAIHCFFNGTYKGEYEQRLVDEFEQMLPEKPPWK
jgi:phosphoglycolate phosphatase-like HAD superfamily hydrolase